jgi:membrane protein DedA with SNARE-associated domain
LIGPSPTSLALAGSFFETLRAYFAEYGYWTVAIALLMENAGLPVPGETILLFAGFLAFSEHQLQLSWVIIIGIVAATLGDNLGYMIGYRGGRPLLMRYRNAFRVPERVIERGEELFRRYGAVTVFFARFIFGMRVITGPLAGVLRMPWRQFVLFNFLGAALWVTIIASAGFLFGRHWEFLLEMLQRANLAGLIVVAAIIIFVWVRYRLRQVR